MRQGSLQKSGRCSAGRRYQAGSPRLCLWEGPSYEIRKTTLTAVPPTGMPASALASWRPGVLEPWHPGTQAHLHVNPNGMQDTHAWWYTRGCRTMGMRLETIRTAHSVQNAEPSAEIEIGRPSRCGSSSACQLPRSPSSPGTKSPSLQVFKLKSKFKCLCPCSRPCPCPCSRLCSNPSFSCRCSFLFYLLIMVVGVWGTTPFLASTIATSSGISPNHPTIANYILFTANSPLPTLYWFSISFISLSICTQTPTPMYFCI